MNVKHSLEVPAEAVQGVPGVTVRWLWAAPDGAPSFALRLFELEPGAATPHHSHPYEHEVYVLSGHALLREKAEERNLNPGDTVLVLPNDLHQFVNSGQEPLKFLCAIPLPAGLPK